MKSLVASNIEARINELGIKKKVAAEMCGYTPQKLSDLLNGRAVIKAEDIEKMSAAFKITPNQLFKKND